MSAIIKKCVVFLLLAAVFLCAGCYNQKTAVDKLHTILDSAAASEKGFEEQQKPLEALEKQEKITYEQIITLGIKQYDKIDKLANDGINNVNTRRFYMEEETKSLKNSERYFRKVAAIKSEINDPELKGMANQLYQLMEKRYKAHDELYKQYIEGLTYDKQLYRMFKNKNLPLSELELQIAKINNTYAQIFAANQNFNKYTREYNAKKLIFYKAAALKTEK